MLKIFNNLGPFFEDCYRRINVREYARMMDLSPPTASRLLASYASEGLLKRELYRNYMLFYANNENKNFMDLSRIYWSHRLKGLVEYIERRVATPTIILFGSLAKAEAKSDSDIDLAIFAHKRDTDFGAFEKKIKRRIQIFWFGSFRDIRNRELANNILNGYLLAGRLPM